MHVRPNLVPGTSTCICEVHWVQEYSETLLIQTVSFPVLSPGLTNPCCWETYFGYNEVKVFREKCFPTDRSCLMGFRCSECGTSVTLCVIFECSRHKLKYKPTLDTIMEYFRHMIKIDIYHYLTRVLFVDWYQCIQTKRKGKPLWSCIYPVGKLKVLSIIRYRTEIYFTWNGTMPRK